MLIGGGDQVDGQVMSASERTRLAEQDDDSRRRRTAVGRVQPSGGTCRDSGPGKATG